MKAPLTLVCYENGEAKKIVVRCEESKSTPLRRATDEEMERMKAWAENFFKRPVADA